MGSVLENMGCSTSKGAPTPGVKAEARQLDESPLTPRSSTHLRGVVGQCMYIAHERCDIQYSTKEVARGVSKPSQQDLMRTKRLVKYLAGSRDLENILEPVKGSSWSIVVRVDSDWATDKVQRRSTS